ncbi:tyrosine recombinase XerD [Clostridium saccharobutylicum]|uniref:tyrosine-type recombinase/integrase n=1 Tax=Clostridium saccharobutylicum TaxID=169679 RepID=UPI000983D647|nr:tyrosine-type recombinase/integrase [Clostridium saccharobutylicum]AQS09030.1 tyrosine recombinase XerD [Clostridium saccharobutylicum]NSB87264.1 integrase [Clostridium saccharobutylicum]NYC28614.1 integrase [Clostridium saccharobutylicum]OOM18297.1 tyrosine recombinase XerD [Clostridium saccharobutylicum]
MLILTNEEYIAFKKLIELYDYLVHNRNGLTPYKLRSDIEKYIRWHDLRHSNATILLKSGISMKIIQERLGHSIMQTASDIYAHVTKEMNTEATDILSNVLHAKKARES